MPFKDLLRLCAVICFSCSLILGMSSCKKDEDDEASEETFSLPPVGALEVGFDEFPDSGQAKAVYDALSKYDYSNSSIEQLREDAYATIALTSTSNFDEAAFKVGVWKLIIDVGLAIPKLAFISAFNHKPVK